MKIVFVSTMNNDPWGGSELLWSKTALFLRREGHNVAASVPGWPESVPQISALVNEGVDIQERWLTPDQFPSRSTRKLIREIFDPLLRQRFRRRFAHWLARQAPDLICISNGSCADNLPVLEICMRTGFPYVMIGHANAEHLWPDDQKSRLILDLYRNARRAFFVSKGNQQLLETQLGFELGNAEIVRNPCNIRRDTALAWPSTAEPVSLACIARLDPRAKGQDLLLHVLAEKIWQSRPIRVSFFGKGNFEQGLRRLSDRLRLQEHVRFCGHVDNIESVWATHHALVLPSRYEGLPLTIVEAMRCGRPAIVTDVAGNAEMIEDGVTGFVAEAATERHLQAALARAWDQRQNWREIGLAAARVIEQRMPPDPVNDFMQRLLKVAGNESAGPQPL